MFVRPICTELDPKGEDTSVVFMLERPSPNPSRFLFVGSFLRSVGTRPPAALGIALPTVPCPAFAGLYRRSAAGRARSLDVVLGGWLTDAVGRTYINELAMSLN